MKNSVMVLLVGFAAVCRAGYVDEVTADGPEAVYRFNEAAGATTLTDATGNGHDSLSVSNVTFGATGPVDSAAVFSNGLVELALQFDPSAGDFSVETLIRFDAAGNVLQQLDGTGTGRAILYRLSDGSIGSYLGQISTTADTLVAPGAWYHVVMTVEEAGTSDVIRFYIDGEAAGSGTADVEAADGNWRIGKGNLIGAIDELAVYTNLLSAEQVMDHYSWVTAGDEDASDSPVHYVSRSGTSVFPYTNWVTAARYIQQAVNAAAAGDTVLVTNGTYASGAQVSVSNAITLASVNGPDVTIVDGQNAHGCFDLADEGCTLSGFTIQNGTNMYGGGIYCASGTVENCFICDNSAFYGGGGVYCGEGTVANCFICDNSSVYYGGGIYCGYSTVESCTICGNSAGQSGGGIRCSGGTVESCIVCGNSADQYDGGGIKCYYGTVESCTVCSNSTGQYGGGVYCYYGTVESCTVCSNSAGQYGGGIYCEELGAVENCVVCSNSASSAGGIMSTLSTVDHCTVYGNDADEYGGIASKYGIVRNSIILGNSDKMDLLGVNNWYNNYSAFSYNCTTPSVGSHCITNNPQLSGLRLSAGSPCIDAGTSIDGLDEDIDGTPRPLDGDNDGSAAVDIGAYEYLNESADSDGDGLTDGDELNVYGSSLVYDDSVLVAAVVAGVTNNPVSYGLYTADSISDLSMGNVMIQTSNGWVRLNLQLEQCTDLVDGSWTNAGDAVEWQVEAPDGTVFYRVKGSE